MQIDHIKAYLFAPQAIKRTLEAESASAKGLRESDIQILATAKLFYSNPESFTAKEIHSKMLTVGRSLHFSYLSKRIKELEQSGHLNCVVKRKMLACFNVSTPNRYVLSMKGRYLLRTLERRLRECSYCDGVGR